MRPACRREPRGHVRVTSPSDSPTLAGTHGYQFFEVSGLPRLWGTPKNASDRIPKLNTRVRFPSSAPPFHLVSAFPSLTESDSGPVLFGFRSVSKPVRFATLTLVAKVQ